MTVNGYDFVILSLNGEIVYRHDIDVWETFFQECKKSIFNPNQNLDRIFFHDFLQFFL